MKREAHAGGHNRPEKATGSDQGSAGELPLSDIRVVDFSRLVPGPWCTQVLSDLGATVIKVEQRGTGDPSRHNPPVYQRDSVYFRSVNAGKLSVAIDLSKARGTELAHRLLCWADVALESFRPSVAAKLQLDYKTARRLNPDVIYCSISGFGQSGPLAHIPGHDLVIQAMSGMLQPGRDGSAPPLPHFLAGDYAAAATACVAVLAGLRKRDRTGEGCFVDVAMFDSLMHMGNISLLSGLSRLAGGTGLPGLEVWGANPRYGIYETADGGYVAVGLLETKVWHLFCQEIGRPDLITAEAPELRHSTHGENAARYREAISQFCRLHLRDDIVSRMIARGIPIMPVLSPDEALSHPNIEARDIVGVVEDEREGRVAELRNPLRAAGLAAPRRRPAPDLSADADTVLSMLGYGKDEIGVLTEEGVV